MKHIKLFEKFINESNAKYKKAEEIFQKGQEMDFYEDALNALDGPVGHAVDIALDGYAEAFPKEIKDKKIASYLEDMIFDDLSS